MIDISIIGTIYNSDGVYDDDGNIVTPPTALDGYHVNTTELPESLIPYQVTPATPMRVFAGGQTYCLKFSDESEFKQVMAEWLPPEPVVYDEAPADL